MAQEEILSLNNNQYSRDLQDAGGVRGGDHLPPH